MVNREFTTMMDNPPFFPTLSRAIDNYIGGATPIRRPVAKAAATPVPPKRVPIIPCATAPVGSRERGAYLIQQRGEQRGTEMFIAELNGAADSGTERRGLASRIRFAGGLKVLGKRAKV